jgi:cysteine desulfuration protein SufE
MFKKEAGIEGMIDYLDYIVENFNAVGPGLPSIELLVDYGHKLRELPQDALIDSNRVPGCISNVYIKSEFSNGRVYYSGSSDSLVVGGYVYMLSRAFSGLTPSEIINSKKNIEDFLSKTKLQANLTPSRANALYNIYNLMVRKAEKYIK